MKPSEILVKNMFSPGRSIYLKFTSLLYEGFVVIFAITTPIFVLLFFVQMDYIRNKNKLDYTALPIESQARYIFLSKEHFKLYNEKDVLLNNLDFSGAREISKTQHEIGKEIVAISKQAPHSSWAYHFYVLIGVIEPF